MRQYHRNGPSLTKTLDHIRHEDKGGKTRGRMASERQINSLPGLLAVKMIRQQISVTNRLNNQHLIALRVTTTYEVTIHS